MSRSLVLCVIVCLAAVFTASGATSVYFVSPDSIYKHISVLADDSLEGRQVGETGEWKAAQYIKGIFQSAGLVPKGDNGTYFQAFEFVKGIDFSDRNKLAINGQALQLNEEFIPLRQSASTRFEFDKLVVVDYGIKVDKEDGDYNDYKGRDVTGKAVIIKRYAPPSKDYPLINFDKYSSLTSKIQTAIDHNVSGIFFVTPKGKDDTLQVTGPVRIHPKKIPIIFLRWQGLERLGLSLSKLEIVSAAGETELIKVRDTGYNVIGYLPTDNDTTTIIGAHFDHLGWGGSTSRYRGKEKMIHNGADDNASGTAGVLELARYFSTRKDSLKYSLLFIAFSGEEAGALGSNYFVTHMTVDSTKIRMMVNMDMIGRLRNQKNGLAVFGTGTCPDFRNYFDTLSHNGIEVVFKNSGGGGSDQISFYNHKIPVLHFFTGVHEDYHKPSDDVDKINFDGAAKVVNLIARIVSDFDKYNGTLVFRETKGTMGIKPHASYSVTLGITPDFITEVKGLRVEAVSPERPAERAGLKEGDIIIRIGHIVVGDIYDYMNALSKFYKGDSAVVVIKRGADTLSLQVVFE